MKNQGYITYYEGLDKEGVAVVSGNHASNVEYWEFVDADKLLTNFMDYLLLRAQRLDSSVTRIIIKNICKL